METIEISMEEFGRLQKMKQGFVVNSASGQTYLIIDGICFIAVVTERDEMIAEGKADGEQVKQIQEI